MSELIVLRGLPGSGKSTLAELLSEQGKYPCISIDDYFTDTLGHYNFIHSENFKAYEQALQRTEKAMQDRHQKIFLHNVFSLDWEMEPYFKLAEKYGYRLFVMTVENYHNSDNVHGISEDQLSKMAAKFKVKLK